MYVREVSRQGACEGGGGCLFLRWNIMPCRPPPTGARVPATSSMCRPALSASTGRHLQTEPASFIPGPAANVGTPGATSTEAVVSTQSAPVEPAPPFVTSHAHPAPGAMHPEHIPTSSDSATKFIIKKTEHHNSDRCLGSCAIMHRPCKKRHGVQPTDPLHILTDMAETVTTGRLRCSKSEHSLRPVCMLHPAKL